MKSKGEFIIPGSLSLFYRYVRLFVWLQRIEIWQVPKKAQMWQKNDLTLPQMKQIWKKLKKLRNLRN